MLASIVIRTYNEERYLDRLLSRIAEQKSDIVDIETVIVDSGSTDSTLEIAKRYNCHITHISKKDFTFGRSLNVGCEFASGDFLVFVSGHCIPAADDWVHELVKPLVLGLAEYTYGRQLGIETSKFSELQLFKKFFPSYSMIPQVGFFCNNANAAITRKAWQRYRFNEDLTGLEDMYLAKQLVSDGGKVAYVATAPVYHIHDESWLQVRTRYEREAIALQKIMPEIHFHLTDFLRCFFSGLLNDFSVAMSEKQLTKKAFEIFMFRLMMYWGTYRGNHEHRKLSAEMKRKYFYPSTQEVNTHEKAKNYSSASHES